MRPATRLALAFLTAALPLSGRAAAAEPSIVEHARDPDTVVIRFSEELGEIGHDDQPWLEVYGDGRVVRHVPVWMKGRGDHESYLGSGETAQLIAPVADAVVAWDEESVAAAKEGVDESLVGTDQELFYVSDASTITIEVRLDRYLAGEPGADDMRDVRREVSYYSLRADAKRYAEVDAIQQLRAVHAALTTLLHSGEVR